MKRLIVLTAVTTLLAMLSGCSIMCKSSVQACDTTSPELSLMQKVKFPRMPWCKGAKSDDCVTCNSGVGGQAYMQGEISNGGVVSGGTIPTESLYSPDVIFDGSSPTYQSAPTIESMPIPTTAITE